MSQEFSIGLVKRCPNYDGASDSTVAITSVSEYSPKLIFSRKNDFHYFLWTRRDPPAIKNV